MSKKESIKKYQVGYPSNLPAKNLIWVLQPTDQVVNKQTLNVYEVTQVVYSPIPGERPEIHANIYGSD